MKTALIFYKVTTLYLPFNHHFIGTKIVLKNDITHQLMTYIINQQLRTCIVIDLFFIFKMLAGSLLAQTPGIRQKELLDRNVETDKQYRRMQKQLETLNDTILLYVLLYRGLIARNWRHALDHNHMR